MLTGGFVLGSDTVLTVYARMCGSGYRYTSRPSDENGMLRSSRLTYPIEVPPELATRSVSPYSPVEGFLGQAAIPHGREPTAIGAWKLESPRLNTSSSLRSMLVRYKRS